MRAACCGAAVYFALFIKRIGELSRVAVGGCAALLLALTFPETADAQYYPSGCPGHWSGGYCICPDGTLAYGYPNIRCGGGGGRPRSRSMPQGSDHCGGNRYCKPGFKCASGGSCLPRDAADCGGGKACKAGTKCSKGGGCVPEDADDCGGGNYCGNGLVCVGTDKCGTQEQADEMKRVEEAKRAAEEAEKKRAADEAKYQAGAPERKKVSDTIKENLEKERAASLAKSAEARQRELREFMAEFGSRSTNCQLVEMGWGAAQGKACALKELEAAPRTNIAAVQPPRDQNWARNRLEELARGKDIVAAPATKVGKNSAAPVTITKQQLDFLRQNSVILQPEARKVATIQTAAAPPSVVAPSTFPPVAIGELQPIDRPTAISTLPYALLSKDSYAETGTGAVGYRAAGDWRALLTKGGETSETIEQLQKSGFGASLFVKGVSATGDREVVIAFRGTEFDSAADWATDIGTRTLRPGEALVPRQYLAAKELVGQVQKEFPNAAIVVTGHSLGGALASYAGNETGISIVTFNAARNPYSVAGTGQRQINISTRGDIIGDPSANSLAGAGRLAGKNYSVDGSSGKGFLKEHGIDGIISSLEAAARN